LLCGAVGKGIRRIARDLGVGTVLRRNFPETIYFPLDGTHDHARWFLKKGPYPRGRRLTILGVSGLGARALTVEPDGLASDGLKGVPSSDFAEMRLYGLLHSAALRRQRALGRGVWRRSLSACKWADKGIEIVHTVERLIVGAQGLHGFIAFCKS
jgi:hypothetical protein